jgi:hypothetical protein
VATTLDRYDEIRQRIGERFQTDPSPRLFRVQCPKCRRMDTTEIRGVSGGEVEFECERCETRTVSDAGGLRGKLSWKLDCAARWSIYGIDMETFSKAHFGGIGTLDVSRFVAEEIYGGRVPRAIMYGDLQIADDVAGRLLDILPPELLKTMLTTRLNRDLRLSKDFVENFCHKAQVRPDMSYVEYVRTELPRAAMRAAGGEGSTQDDALSPQGVIPERTLVRCGNAFSRFFYGREHKVELPDGSVLETVDLRTAEVARGLIHYALSVRRGEIPSSGGVKGAIRSYLAAQEPAPEVYPFLRKLFRQVQGPNVATLLAILPEDYLKTVQLLLTHFAASRAAATAIQAVVERPTAPSKRRVFSAGGNS